LFFFKKIIKINNKWSTVKEFIPLIYKKTKEYGDVYLTKEHEYHCRLVTTCKSPKGRKQKISRGKISSKIGGGSYEKSSKEPWILATSLSSEKYKADNIVTLYSKRMQIEETFRDIKSHQFGLSGRYVRALNVLRWATLILLASIVIISYGL
jgi:hypothetical protein